MEEGKVRAVLEWLRDLLEWGSRNPSKIDSVINELARNSGVIKEALKEALEDDLKDYVGIVYELITGQG